MGRSLEVKRPSLEGALVEPLQRRTRLGTCLDVGGSQQFIQAPSLYQLAIPGIQPDCVFVTQRDHHQVAGVGEE